MKKAMIIGLLGAALSTAQAQDFREMDYSPVQTSFKLLAPDDAKAVKVRIYKDGQGGKAEKTVKMKKTGTDTYEATVSGDMKGMFYTFDIG